MTEPPRAQPADIGPQFSHELQKTEIRTAILPDRRGYVNDSAFRTPVWVPNLSAYFRPAATCSDARGRRLPPAWRRLWGGRPDVWWSA